MKSVALSLIVAAFLVLSGCGDETDEGASQPAAEQTVSGRGIAIRVSIDHDRLTTTGQLLLMIDVTTTPGASGSPPELTGDLGGFTIIEQNQSAPRLAADGGLTSSTTYTLEPFLPGDYTIPPIDIAYTSPDGVGGTIKTGPMAVTVDSVLPPDQKDVAEVAPLRDVVEPAPARSGNALVWIVGAGAAAAGGCAGAWVILRRRKPLRADRCAQATKRLRQISKAPLDPGASGHAVVEASSLVRGCLAERLDPAAATRTTEELLASARLAERLSERDMAALAAGLRTSDSIKFAGATITEAEARQMMEAALGLVGSLSRIEETTPTVPTLARGTTNGAAP